jgi:hypothetical protein
VAAAAEAAAEAAEVAAAEVAEVAAEVAAAEEEVALQLHFHQIHYQPKQQQQQQLLLQQPKFLIEFHQLQSQLLLSPQLFHQLNLQFLKILLLLQHHFLQQKVLSVVLL